MAVLYGFTGFEIFAVFAAVPLTLSVPADASVPVDCIFVEAVLLAAVVVVDTAGRVDGAAVVPVDSFIFAVPVAEVFESVARGCAVMLCFPLIVLDDVWGSIGVLSFRLSVIPPLWAVGTESLPVDLVCTGGLDSAEVSFISDACKDAVDAPVSFDAPGCAVASAETAGLDNLAAPDEVGAFLSDDGIPVLLLLEFALTVGLLVTDVEVPAVLCSFEL